MHLRKKREAHQREDLRSRVLMSCGIVEGKQHIGTVRGGRGIARSKLTAAGLPDARSHKHTLGLQTVADLVYGRTGDGVCTTNAQVQNSG